MLFTNITGKKEVKGFNKPFVIACPTKGEFRLTPLVQKTLGVADGDSVVITTHPEDASRVFLAKGIAGVPTRDENGVIQKDGRGRTIYEDESGFGAVARTASEGSSLLKFTGTAGWNAVDGDENFNKYFTLGEGIASGVATGREDERGDAEVLETVFYELIFVEQKAKAKRKSADGEDTDEDDDSDEAFDATDAVSEEI